VQHCGGGPGPNRFVGTWTDAQHDMALALEHWVEDGVAPRTIIASGTAPVARTRPICPYPQVARYSGSGSVDDAASFSCVAGGAKR
jgi:feruloyl esterase